MDTALDTLVAALEEALRVERLNAKVAVYFAAFALHDPGPGNRSVTVPVTLTEPSAQSGAAGCLFACTADLPLLDEQVPKWREIVECAANGSRNGPALGAATAHGEAGRLLAGIRQDRSVAEHRRSGLSKLSGLLQAAQPGRGWRKCEMRWLSQCKRLAKELLGDPV